MPNVSETATSLLEKRKPKESLKLRKMRERMNPPPKLIPNEPAATYREAAERLRDKSWNQSQQHKDKVKFTDYSCASPQLTEFCRKLVRKAGKMSIPLDVVSASYDVAVIVHSRRLQYLSPKEWEIIAHLGAETSRTYGLKVHWGGLGLPSIWMGEAALRDSSG